MSRYNVWNTHLKFCYFGIMFSRITYGSESQSKFQFKWCGIMTQWSETEEAWEADSHLPHYVIST